MPHVHDYRKPLAGLVAATIISGLGANIAYADTAVNLSGKEDITVTATGDNAFTGKENTLQAILLASYKNATASDGHLTGVSVVTNSAYSQAVKNALTAAGVKGFNETNPMDKVADMEGDLASDPVQWASELRKFATSLNTQSAITGATGATGTVSDAGGGTDNLLTFTGLTPGYYLIRDTTPSGKTGAIPMLVGTEAGGLDFADQDLGTVVYKSITDNDGDGSNLKPPVKSVDDGDSQAAHKVGDTIEYTVEQKVPNTTGYPGYYLALTDHLGDGLDYVPDSYEITVDDAPLDAQYVHFVQDEVEPGYLSWEFGLDNTGTYDILTGSAASVFTPGATIRLTYRATVNSDATDSAENASNSVELIYSNNPNDWRKGLGHAKGETPDGEGPVEILTASGSVYATDYEKNPIADAKFQVGEYDEDGDFTPLKFVDNKDGSYTLADADDADTVDTFTSDEDGVQLKGLLGDYEVKQTKTPAGQDGDYMADFTFTASAERKDASTVTEFTVTDSKNLNDLGFQYATDSVGFMNVASKSQLPNTGSRLGGLLTGVALLAAACGLVFAVRANRNHDLPSLNVPAAV